MRRIDSQAGLAEVFFFEMPGNPCSIDIDARVEPGLGMHGRDMGLFCHVDSGGIGILSRQGGQLLSIPLLDHAEAAKFTLLAIEVTVMVGISSDEFIPAEVVVS